MKINIAEPYTDKKIKYKILEVIESRHYVEGRYTKQFEEEFSKYIGVKHAVTVSSGTSSLFLILKALGIGPGDKIAVPDFTFIATLSQGVLLGAKPVLIDVDYETMCMDPDDLRRKLDEDVKAVIPVHLFGHPAPMDEIIDIAVEYGAYVIEDAAQAHGAKY
ncbi:TPA: aminotransferase class I/II-fold pyridoxal phosphate-dependent enzyme, partial [Candidatus Geothermarchaeota archaeon]|nr:aminotransferase class I/II-fold pyridoxal phosphate-dependent enzyme [Candidatus Geothermarchaeota archaeon]